MKTLLTSEQLKKSTVGVQLVNGEYKPGEVMTSNDWLQLAVVKMLHIYKIFRQSGFTHSAARTQALLPPYAGKLERETALAIIDTHPQDWQM